MAEAGKLYADHVMVRDTWSVEPAEEKAIEEVESVLYAVEKES